MTELTKSVKRKSPVSVYDRGKLRPLMVSIEPAGRDNAVIGIRVAGTRDTYRLGIQTILNVAIRKHDDDTKRLAAKLQKEEQLSKRSALARARREMAKELRK